MKKSSIVTIIVILVIIAGIVWFGRNSGNGGQSENPGGSPTPVAAVENTKVSSKTSKYENDELGFSVNYPTAWEADNTNSGVTFIIPIDQSQVSTVAKLQADITILSAKCAFPPVTTVKERQTVAVGAMNFSMISMANTVQGRDYFNRMYSLQSGNICYLFTFSAITLSPESKGLTGSNVTQAQNNNKAIVSTADGAFSDMVKSFAFVQAPQGKDETQVNPAK